MGSWKLTSQRMYDHAVTRTQKEKSDDALTVTEWQTLGTEYSHRHMLGPAKTLAFSFCGLPNMDSSKQYNWSPQRKETKQIEKMPPRFMGNFLVLGLVILVLSPLFLPGLLVIFFALSPPSLILKTAKKGCKDEAKWERSSFELPVFPWKKLRHIHLCMFCASCCWTGNWCHWAVGIHASCCWHVDLCHFRNQTRKSLKSVCTSGWDVPLKSLDLPC